MFILSYKNQSSILLINLIKTPLIVVKSGKKARKKEEGKEKGRRQQRQNSFVFSKKME
jgi:hypothetical protein